MAYTLFVKLAPDTVGADQYLIQLKALTLESAKRLATTLEVSGDTILAITETVQDGPYQGCERVLVLPTYVCDECGHHLTNPDDLVAVWYIPDALTCVGALICQDCYDDRGLEYRQPEDGEHWEHNVEVTA